MPPYVLDTLAPLIALLSVGTMGLIALKFWLDAKTARLTKSGGEDLKQLTEAVERLDEQLQVLREQVTDLDERLEFAERVLARGAEERGRLGAGDR